MSEALEQVQEVKQRRFRPYPEYKDSGVEWLGEIPAGWEIRGLKRISPQITVGIVVNPSTYVSGEGVPFIYGSDIREGRIVPETARRMSREDSESQRKSRLYAGDLVTVRVGAPGVTAVVTPELEGANCASVVIIRGSSSFDSRWLCYAINSRVVRYQIEVVQYGAAQEQFNVAHAVEFLVPSPPLEEQRELAEFLDRETAKIDALVARKERLIELLQEKRTALITRAVTRGLDPTNSPGANLNAGRRAGGPKGEGMDSPSNVPLKDSGVEWLGEIPAHWEVKRLWHFTPSDRRIMYGIVLPGPNVDEGVPIVKGGDVAAARLRLETLCRTTFEIESRYARSRLRGGDLVYAIRGSIGEVEMVPDELQGANLTQDAARVAHTSESNGRWLLYALRSERVFAQLESGALGATIKGINIRDLKRALIPVPPMSEQEEIAAFLDREGAKFHRLALKVREAIDDLKEFRTALISAAVTGKIDVREETI